MAYSKNIKRNRNFSSSSESASPHKKPPIIPKPNHSNRSFSISPLIQNSSSGEDFSPLKPAYSHHRKNTIPKKQLSPFNEKYNPPPNHHKMNFHTDRDKSYRSENNFSGRNNRTSRETNRRYKPHNFDRNRESNFSNFGKNNRSQNTNQRYSDRNDNSRSNYNQRDNNRRNDDSHHNRYRSPPQRRFNQSDDYSPNPIKPDDNKRINRYSDKPDYDGDRNNLNEDKSDDKIDDKGILLSYKDFLLRQKDDITPEEAQTLYDQYKKEYHLSNTKIFFERHKNEEWFREKYCPSLRLEVFKRQLKLSETLSNGFLGEIIKLYSDGKKGNDGEIKNFLEKYNLLRDFDAFEFIKNVTKEIDIEDEFCRMKEIERRLYDERQKSGVFSDSDSDYEEKPTVTKDINSEEKESKTDFSSSFGKNLSNLGRDIVEKTRNNKKNVVSCDENSVFISTIPLKINRSDLLNVFNKIDGFQKMCISEPIPKYGMNRFAWVTYDNQSNCRKALELNGFKIKYSNDYPPLYLHILPKKKSSKCVRPAHFYTIIEKRVVFDIKQALKIIEVANHRKMFEKKFDEKYLSVFDDYPKIVLLNLLISYLRLVHNFCYYCGVDYGTEEGLMSRCTKEHPRNTIINVDNERNFRFSTGNEEEDESKRDYRKWTINLDEKITKYLDNDESKQILNWSEIAQDDYIKSKSLDIKNGRYRCALCSKMFVAEQFVRKHVGLKHSKELVDFMKGVEDDIFFSSYKLDSNRFLLENVESLIPGDVTSQTSKSTRPFYQSTIHNGSNYGQGGNNIFGGSFRGRNYRGDYGRKSMYTDWDKPAGDGEEEIDYGFASETTPMFHL